MKYHNFFRRKKKYRRERRPESRKYPNSDSEDEVIKNFIYAKFVFPFFISVNNL